MVQEVNKIIYNMLISGRGVFLPEVGTLYIERQAARKLADGRLLSPRNAVVFVDGVQAPSLVEEIVAIAGCSTEQAQDIYERWQSKTLQDGVLTIGGVGALKGKSFSTDKAFHSAINPQGVKTLVVRKKKSSNTWLYVVSAVAVVVALGFFAYLMWGDKFMGKQSAEKVVATQVVAPETTAVEQTEQVAEEQVAEPVAEPVVEPVAEPQVDRGSYAYYVVMGVFSTPENAERAVKDVEAKVKDASCVVMPFKNKHMVTIFGSDNVADCNTFARSYRDVYHDLWIHKKE